jgi:putative flippase GtrA
MTGIFLMMVLSLVLLLVDAHLTPGLARRVAGAVGATGLVAAFLGTTLWTFVDPSHNGPSYVIYVAGIAISYLAVFAAAIAVRTVQTRGFDPATP